MPVIQKSSAINFFDSIFDGGETFVSGDYDQATEMLAGLKKDSFESGEEVDSFLLTIVIDQSSDLRQIIENSAQKLTFQSLLLSRLRVLLPSEYERLYIQLHSTQTLPTPLSFRITLPKVTASLKLARFVGRSFADFEAKKFARNLVLAEASFFLALDEREFLNGCMSSVSVFIDRYNRLTNSLISAILNEPEQAVVFSEKILKVAKEFYNLGAMNGFKACLAALQSTSIHRLNLKEQLSSKYRKRLERFEAFAQPIDNYANMRQQRCYVPWIGLLLKDSTFILEARKLMDVNQFNFGGSLRKIFQSISEARAACFELLQKNQEGLFEAAKLVEWLEGTTILYETEESQYQRSLIIQH